jgi:hypothetical protein
MWNCPTHKEMNGTQKSRMWNCPTHKEMNGTEPEKGALKVPNTLE